MAAILEWAGIVKNGRGWLELRGLVLHIHSVLFEKGGFPMAVCPKCGGTNIQFQRETVGTSYNSSYKQTGVKRSWIFPSDIRKGRQTIDYKTVGFCGDCGYTWEIEKDGKRSGWRYFFFLILWPIALSMWFWKTQRCGWIKDGEPLYYRRHGLLFLLLARCPVKK